MWVEEDYLCWGYLLQALCSPQVTTFTVHNWDSSRWGICPFLKFFPFHYESILVSASVYNFDSFFLFRHWYEFEDLCFLISGVCFLLQIWCSAYSDWNEVYAFSFYASGLIEFFSHFLLDFGAPTWWRSVGIIRKDKNRDLCNRRDGARHSRSSRIHRGHHSRHTYIL